MFGLAMDQSVAKYLHKPGERATSDVIVRLRTGDGRDSWFYSHAKVLAENSKYFAVRLSSDWPTYQLLDSRLCIELRCVDSDIDFHVTLLRLLYAKDERLFDMWHTVTNALGILKVASKLQCEKIVAKCLQYLEAVPWEENEEEEMLNTLPALGASVSRVLARIQPVDEDAVRNVFISAIRVATLPERKCRELSDNFSSEVKAAAQEQVEYMLVEDDDAPLIVADEIVKSEMSKCFSEVFEGFKLELAALLPEEKGDYSGSEQLVLERISDLTWSARVLEKIDLMDHLVLNWIETSGSVLKVLTDPKLNKVLWETKFKVVDLTSKVLEAVGYGTVIIPTDKRSDLVRFWLPYIRVVTPAFEANFRCGKLSQQMDKDLSQTIELAFVSLILSLPSVEQANILTEWLKKDQAGYPDLTEAFEVWCFRSKSAKRRFGTQMSGAGTAIETTGCGV